MVIRIILFASLKEKLRASDVSVECNEEISIGGLREKLVRIYPQSEDDIRRALAAVDYKFAFDEELIPEGSEVAFFPPVSGGSAGRTIARITREPLDHNALIEEITNATTGAVCSFVGVVRGITQTEPMRRTTHLEYEAYRPMAEAKLIQLAEEIRQKWTEVDGIAIVQRIGLMDSGTLSVVVACSAAHRDSGVFEAVRFGIDRLKEIVPIWKKEIGPEGEMWIDGDYQVKPGD